VSDEKQDGTTPDVSRRRLFKYAGLAALAGSGLAGAWFVSRSGEDAESDPESRDTPAPVETPTETPTEPAPARVRRYAPDLYFGRLEKWYPTDPRLYTVEREGETVVDGFTALQGYTERFAEADGPPDPTVFYHEVTDVVDGVDAIQYWLYSAFDQFTVNFHWHDWELLQVFVDSETSEPLLLSASAHSRKVPNNEFGDPDGDRRPGILSEVGSHSSASEVNDVVPSFERIDTDRWHSDVTNDAVDIPRGVTAPFAYGLLRDEGARLPFVMPELDGQPLDDHPSLSLDRDAFVDESVTVVDWRGLPRPPSDLPLREPGLVVAHPESARDADVPYRLEEIGVLTGDADGDEPADETDEDDREGGIDDFVGPQLSFEFAIPGFVEDRFADHITTVGIPWEQDRFDDPLDDITDPAHRELLGADAPGGLLDRVVGRVRQLRSGADGALDGVTETAREVLGDRIPVSRSPLPAEVAVQLASEDPDATVTRSGVFEFLDVSRDEHRLVVNGPGVAPLAERFRHDGGLVRAGADGDLTVVAREDAAWIRGDGRGAAGVERVRIVEDYAGVVYDGRPVEEDRFAVAVHREGTYTVEIEDEDGRPGADRVGPADFEAAGPVPGRVETGKASLVGALVDRLADLLDLARSIEEDIPTPTPTPTPTPADDQIEEDTPTPTPGDDQVRSDIPIVGGAQVEGGILDDLASALESARDAATAAEEGNARVANARLSLVVSSLDTALFELETGTRYSDAVTATLDPLIREAIDRTERAQETPL
jgi:hypothetical protein